MLSIAKTSTHLADPHELIIEAEACRSHLNNLARRAITGNPSVTIDELSRLRACLNELLISHKVLHRQSLGSPCDWRRRFLHALLVLVALLLTSCGEPRLVNDGPTHYWLVPQSELDADYPRHLCFVPGDFSAHISIAQGDCTRDGSRIRLAFKTDDWKHQHECAHAIDAIGDDMDMIRRAFGSGCPDCVYTFLDACDAYQRTHPVLRPHWAWRVLQNMYPRDSVIQHPQVIADLQRQDGDPAWRESNTLALIGNNQ